MTGVNAPGAAARKMIHAARRHADRSTRFGHLARLGSAPAAAPPEEGDHDQEFRTTREIHAHVPPACGHVAHASARFPFIANEADADLPPDQRFPDGVIDAIDPDLRYRMISEAAYRRYAERGYEDGYDQDDWLEAEEDVDHFLRNGGPAV